MVWNTMHGIVVAIFGVPGTLILAILDVIGH